MKFTYFIIVSEPEFSEYNKYTKEYYDTGESNKEDIYFELRKKNYNGKYNYFNIYSNYNLTEIGCQDNCELCYSFNKDKCITCSNNTFYYDENNDKICKKKNDNDIESEPIESNEKFSDSDFDYCKLKEIIQNNCFEEIILIKPKKYILI